MSKKQESYVKKIFENVNADQKSPKKKFKQIIDFENKTKFLYNEFFFAFFSANFSDISKAIHLTKIDCLKLIIKQEMKKTMR